MAPWCVPMSARSLLFLLGGLALGTGLVSACTSGSSHSSPPDTTAASAAPGALVDSSTRRPSGELPSPTDTASRSVSQRLADASVAARAKRALARHRTLRRFDFSPSVVRGHLTLRGDVSTREQYREAERVVTALGAVRAVTNEVTVDGRPATNGNSSSDTAYHTVRRGDTLSEIARRYGVSVQQLRRLNDGASSLQPGERIRVQ